jgi:hypothetical protein
MKRTAILGLAGALAAAIGLLAAAPAAATPQLAKAEGLACTVCHDKPGSKLLTDKGKYYEVMATLDGYDAIEGTFGACTTCHVKRPGSKKLTRQGRRISLVIRDMGELKAWVMEHHPQPGAEPGAEPGGGEGEGMEGEGGAGGGGDGFVPLLAAHRPLR